MIDKGEGKTTKGKIDVTMKMIITIKRFMHFKSRPSKASFLFCFIVTLL